VTSPTLTWEQYQQLPPDKRRRPLTSAEYAALTRAQKQAAGLEDPDEGAPADFAGPVFPNPDHIQPQLDTDPEMPVTRLPSGVSFQADTWKGPAPALEIAAKMDPQQIKLPPGATLETPPPPAAMKLPPGATLETAPPAAEDEPGILDREIPITNHWAATASGLQSVARGTRDAVKGMFSLLDPRPQNPEEEAVAAQAPGGIPGGGHAALPVYRILRSIGHTAQDATQIAGAIHDINNSPDPVGTYEKAAQETAGQGAGQAITALATEGLSRGVTSAAKAIAKNPTAAVTAPVRLAARTAETALNQKLIPLKKLANLNTPADVAESLDVKVPGRDLGLTVVRHPVTGKPEFSDVVAAQKQAAAPPAAAAAPAPTPAAAPPAAAVQPPPAPVPAPAAAAAPAAAPELPTSSPAAAKVTPQGETYLDRLNKLAAEIRAEEAAGKGPKAEVPGPEENLEQKLKDSLAVVEARKAAGQSPVTGAAPVEVIPRGGVHTTAEPKALLDRWGVDENSFTEGRSQTRGMKPDESAAAIAKLKKAYQSGTPVQPVLETRDAANNIIDVDGRGRALAAHKAGIERIPIIVRRIGVQ